MCLTITSIILQPSVSVFNTGTGPNLACTSFIALECPGVIHPIHNMSLPSTTDSPIHIIGQVMLLAQLEDLYIQVYFCFLDHLSVSLFIKTCFIDIFVKGTYLTKRPIVLIWTRRLAIISECRPLSDPPAVSQTNLNSRIYSEELQDNKNRTPPFQLKTCVAILQNPEALVSVMTSSSTFIYMGYIRVQCENEWICWHQGF